LALFNYFLAFAITGAAATHPNAKLLLLPVAVLSAYFYVTNIAASVELDTRLKELHDCPGTPRVVIAKNVKTAISRRCPTSVGLWEFIKISARYITSSTLLAGVALYFAVIAGD
jgi:hypothetical protein